MTRKLAGFIEIRPAEKRVAPDRIQAVVKVGIPEPDQLSALLLNRDIRYLSRQEIHHFSQILETLDQKRTPGFSRDDQRGRASRTDQGKRGMAHFSQLGSRR